MIITNNMNRLFVKAEETCVMSFTARSELCFQSYEPVVQKPGHGGLFVRPESEDALTVLRFFACNRLLTLRQYINKFSVFEASCVKAVNGELRESVE